MNWNKLFMKINFSVFWSVPIFWYKKWSTLSLKHLALVLVPKRTKEMWYIFYSFFCSGKEIQISYFLNGSLSALITQTPPGARSRCGDVNYHHHWARVYLHLYQLHRRHLLHLSYNHLVLFWANDACIVNRGSSSHLTMEKLL